MSNVEMRPHLFLAGKEDGSGLIDDDGCQDNQNDADASQKKTF